MGILKFENLPRSPPPTLLGDVPCIFTDTLPKDVDLIKDLAHRVSLSCPDSVWAKTISEIKTLEQRESACEIVKEKDYDISSSAKQLQDFYLSLMRGKE